MTNKPKKVYIGYRMPRRFYDKIIKLLPIYDDISAVLTAILTHWETSDLYRQQILTLQKMRYRLLEHSKEQPED